MSSLNGFTFNKTRIAIFLILASLIIISLAFSNAIESVINNGVNENMATLDHNGLQAHFINVGQGDAIMLELPDNKTMLIDAGPSGNADKLIDYLNNNVLEETNIIDYVVITHSDTDHIGAMDEILDTYQVNKIYRPRIYATYNNLETAPEGSQSKDTQTYHKVIERVVAEPDCEVVFSDEGSLDILGGSGLSAYQIKFLSPNEGYYSDVNDFSPIMLIEYSGKIIMLTGDASLDVEEEVMLNHSLPEVDILKLGHHGSSTSTGSELLTVIKPDYAVVSASEDNQYNHPHQETINRLIYAGTDVNNILETSNNGSINFNITTNGQLNIFTEFTSIPVYIQYEAIAISIIIVLFFVSFKKTNTY